MSIVLLNRGRRRSRCLMTEPGRSPSYWRPHGAPGGAAAYVTGRASPRKRRSSVTGILSWVRLVGREVRPAGLVSLLTKGGDPPWRLPALHSLVGKRKKGLSARRRGERRAPGVSKPPARGAL